MDVEAGAGGDLLGDEADPLAGGVGEAVHAGDADRMALSGAALSVPCVSASRSGSAAMLVSSMGGEDR